MSERFVFLHGGGQGSWIWDETIDAMRLQGGGTIGATLALDIPGCGVKRGRATDETSVDDIVADLVADIEGAGIEDAILVGHSQAGTIIPLVLKSRPSLFRHVVYVSCLAPTGGQTGLDWPNEMPEAGSALSGTHVLGSRDFFRAMFCNDMDADVSEAFIDKLGIDQWPASSYAMSGWFYDHLRDVGSSYVLCLRDQALPPPWQRMFAERVHAKDIIQIDAGHQAMNTRPHGLAEILRLVAARTWRHRRRS
jgi:pimeloyl-ACP methyl ester carboxylesterase